MYVECRGIVYMEGGGVRGYAPTPMQEIRVFRLNKVVLASIRPF